MYFYFPGVRLKQLQHFVDKNGFRYTDEICLHEKHFHDHTYGRIEESRPNLPICNKLPSLPFGSGLCSCSTNPRSPESNSVEQL